MEKRIPPFIQETKNKYENKSIEVWFQDETRFGQKGRLTKIWAETNTRPIKINQNEHKSAYLFGAVNPITGNSHGLIVSTVSTDLMNLFLAQISKKMSRWKHCVLIVDGAGWHRSDDILVPKNITLLPLPPYSPELNCIERLWNWIKDNYLSLKVFPNEDAIYEAGCLAWQHATPEIIRSVCHTPWLLSSY